MVLADSNMAVDNVKFSGGSAAVNINGNFERITTCLERGMTNALYNL